MKLKSSNKVTPNVQTFLTLKNSIIFSDLTNIFVGRWRGIIFKKVFYFAIVYCKYLS